MCELKAYLYKEGKEELYLENVDILRAEGDKIYLKSLFGEEKVFEGRIKEVNIRKNSVLLER